MFLELCVVIHFVWLKHKPNQATLSELDEVYGKDMISLQAVEKWTAAFDGGLTELADLPKSRRPRDTGKVHAVPALIEGEGYISQKKIAQMLGIHHETVKHILRDDVNMPKGNSKSVPHALDSSQKAIRIQVSQEPLDFLESHTDRSLLNVSTGDETRVYLDNPRTSRWIGPDVTKPIRVRHTVMSKKRMFWIDFCRTGIRAVVMLPAWQCFNKDFFAGTVLPSIVGDRALSRPKLKVSGTFLHLDIARPHLTSDKHDKFGIKRLRHPLYSPDLALCDFWLFGCFKHCLERRFVDDNI
jgi:hypothetical protein